MMFFLDERFLLLYWYKAIQNISAQRNGAPAKVYKPEEN